MKIRIISLFVFFCAFNSMFVVGQDVSDNRMKIETEPGLFFNNGRSIGLLYNPTEDNNLWVGLYAMATDIPSQIADDMFVDYNDSMNVSVTQEYAVYARYRLRFWKDLESNPYVGLIAGWENLQVKFEGKEDLNIGTFIVTPHIGYELYMYKRIMYMNTQIRFPFYLGATKSDESRTEKLNAFTMFPAISIGARF